MLTTQELDNLIELAVHGTADDLGVAVAIIDALDIDTISKLIIIKHSKDLRDYYRYTIQSYFTGGVINYRRIYYQYMDFHEKPTDLFIYLIKWSLLKFFGSLEEAKKCLDTEESVNYIDKKNTFRLFIRNL